MSEDTKREEENTLDKSYLTKKIATAGVFIAVGLVLSFINPFAYFNLFGTKINPFAHYINSLMGVLIGLLFAFITALGIASLRFTFGIGTIHAFHGGISGAIVVGIVAAVLWKKNSKKIELAALTEPIGTVFIGGTIAYFIAPFGGISILEGLTIYWILFALSSIPGSIMGYLTLLSLKKAGITRKDFY